MDRKIFIDPGHGGEDPGATADGVQEKDLNLSIARLMQNELKLAGFFTAMSRYSDEFISLHDRAVDANSWHADAFVSIHNNANDNPDAKGFSVHIHPNCSNEAAAIADAVHASLRAAMPGHKDRGIEKNNFQVLRDTRMPAILVECEFVTNAETRAYLNSPDNQAILAKAIAAGLAVYFNGRT